MINNDLFITIVVMFVLSILSLFVLAGVAIWSGVEFYKYKTFKFLPVKLSLILIPLLVIYFGIPFWFLGAAYNNYNSEKAESFYDLAIKTALLPSVKALMHYEKGSFYSLAFKGSDAINAYEKSYEIKKDDAPLHQLCLLYTVKGDYDKAVGTCVQTSHNQMAAINSILNKNYPLALNVINIEFKNEQPTCWDYAVRGYIYRALGRKDRFESDFDTAFNLCPKNDKLRELYENSSYYEEYYTDLRKKFHF